MLFWNKHFKNWNRQYILCVLHEINIKLHCAAWASVIECEPYKIVQESLGWGGCHPASVCPCPSRVLLTAGGGCCAQDSGIYWNLAPGVCLSRDPNLQIPPETLPATDTCTDSFSSACPHLHKIHSDGEGAEV